MFDKNMSALLFDWWHIKDWEVATTPYNYICARIYKRQSEGVYTEHMQILMIHENKQ